MNGTIMNTKQMMMMAFERGARFFKLVFIRLMRVLEVSAVPYLLGIAAAVAMEWKLSDAHMQLLNSISVLGTLAILYLPIFAMYAVYIYVRLKKEQARLKGEYVSVSFFLEDEFGEHAFTRFLVGLLIIVSFGFGALNYNLAVDTSSKNHLVHYLAQPGDRTKVMVEGEIIREPEFRDFSVWLYIKPVTITANDENINIDRGLILAKVSKQVSDYDDFEYGQLVELKGSLDNPEPATNPGTFNYRKFLNNRNVFALMSIYNENQIEIIGERKVNLIVRLSLAAKVKLLRIMKQTLPYPHSAFQGGIIYGLKTGLPYEQHMEFKWAGMAWILVVAGAHLLMVYLTLKMILESMRPNPKLGFLALFLLLFMFLIITGINPPTVRAFIMLFLYEFTKVFLGQDTRSAVTKAIAIAAFLLLATHMYPYFSPLMIFDATVTLSFGAVLSLSFLSRPVERLFRRYLYGFNSMVALISVITMVAVVMIYKPTTLSLLGSQLLPIAVLTLFFMFILTVIGNRYRERYKLDRIYLGYNNLEKFHGLSKWFHPQYFSYNNLPKFVLSFLGAQVAIQFGMVLPLSSVYFQRSPIGGLIANLIGFPALGVIIQVGLIAVLAGMIPVIGIPIAYVLNAADYIGIDLLIKVAHFTSKHFPYPLASKPLGRQTFGYYLMMIFIVLLDRVFYDQDKRGYLTVHGLFAKKHAKTKFALYGKLKDLTSSLAGSTAVIIVALALLGSSVYYLMRPDVTPNLRVLVMELDGGSGTMVKTPGGKKYLIDAGKVDTRGTFNIGERTIAPVLLCQQIETLDGVILTNINETTIGGMPYILENFEVMNFYSPYDQTLFDPEAGFEDFVGRLGGEDNFKKFASSKNALQAVHKQFIEVSKILRKKNINIVTLSAASEPLFREDGIVCSVLYPARDSSDAAAAPNLVLKLEAGAKSMLIAGNIDPSAIQLDDARLKSTVLLLPGQGAEANNTPEFIKAVSPEHAVVQFSARGWWVGKLEAGLTSVLDLYAEAGAKGYRTDRTGAVVMEFSPSGAILLKTMM